MKSLFAIVLVAGSFLSVSALAKTLHRRPAASRATHSLPAPKVDCEVVYEAHHTYSMCSLECRVVGQGSSANSSDCMPSCLNRTCRN